MPLPNEIDRRLLHLFVFGPGYGEGVVVALPGAGWLVVDGCRMPGQDAAPIVELLDQLRGGEAEDPLDALVLTHPHRDHFHGFADVLEAHPPRRLGCVAEASTGRWASALAAEFVADVVHGSPTRARGAELAALCTAIEAYWARNPESRLRLFDAVNVPVAADGVSVTARAPDLDGLRAFEQLSSDALLERANELSIVLEVEWGATRLVLGADLPHRRRRNGPLAPTGWQRVTQDRPEVGRHVGLKCPHHGSSEAFHPNLHTPRGSGQERAWLLTPWNSAGGLPRLEDEQGLAELLSMEPEILLTAPPLGTEAQAHVDGGDVTLAELRHRVVEARAGEWEMVDLTTDGAGRGDDRAWAVALDDRGIIVQRWQGQRAIRVRA